MVAIAQSGTTPIRLRRQRQTTARLKTSPPESRKSRNSWSGSQPRTPENAYPRISGELSGYRFYSPSIGRWLSRDPIWEHSWWLQRRGGSISAMQASAILEVLGRQGEINVYGVLKNSPATSYDPLGLACQFNKTLGKCVEPKPKPYNPTTYNNGCGGIEPWEYDLVPNDPMGKVSSVSCPFTGVCNVHDTCYWTCNSDKSACDYQFYSDMLGACYDCWSKNFSSWNPSGWVWLGDCTAFAATYYAAVAAKGSYDYKKYAQPQACQDCCCP